MHIELHQFSQKLLVTNEVIHEIKHRPQCILSFLFTTFFDMVETHQNMKGN